VPLFRLRESPREKPRCAFCHGDLAHAGWTCPRCGTELHVDCAREAGKCTTLGCETTTLRERAPARPRPAVVPHVSRRDAWIGTGVTAAALLVVIFLGWFSVNAARPSYSDEWAATRGQVVSVAQDKASVRVEYRVEGERHEKDERTRGSFHVGEDVPVSYRRSDPDRSFIGVFRDDASSERTGRTVVAGMAGALLLAFMALIWKKRRESVRRYGDA
jgi:hypothetical protein